MQSRPVRRLDLEAEVGGRTVGDIAIGLSARFSKTVSESDVYQFAGITGDLDPNHVDEEFCRGTSLGHRVAHGALIVGYMSAASSRVLEDFDRPMVSVGYDRIRFLKPVYLGDTITVHYVIGSVDAKRERILAKVEVKNQRDELVCVADHIMQLVD
jgi:3-hydroxybutyryl-CoA dehydratase